MYHDSSKKIVDLYAIGTIKELFEPTWFVFFKNYNGEDSIGNFYQKHEAIKKLAIPVLSRKAPNMINTTINLEHTSTGVENTPVFV